ncbi:MAG: iron ABC transporter permease [Gammaproteobacteria bacterium]|nr:iron ABC transporter permease [Gammaproteobacteria bacterium]
MTVKAMRRLMTGRPGAGAWPLGAVAVAALCLLPVAAVLWLALFPAENIWPHLIATTLPGYVGNTLILLAGVGVSTLLTGVTAARLVTAFDFPLRKLLEWLLLLPLAMPGYVIAYLYTDLLEFAGPVQHALRAVFGWRLAGDYWFPEVRSMGGAIMLLGVVLYPYVYLLARASFLEQSSYLPDVSRLLGRGPVATFFYVELPIARPAIAVGVALALMETLNDFGTVDFFSVQTLTAGLYDVWLNMGNLGGGAQIGAVMLTFAALLISLEYIGRRRRRFYQSATRFGGRPRQRLRGRNGWAATAVCAAPVLFGFGIPALLLVSHALDHLPAAWTPRFRGYALNSLWVSGTASVSAVALAVVVAYARRLRRTTVMAAIARAASLGYAVPGAVLAVGVIVPLAAFDNAVDAFLRARFGVGSGLILSGTSFAVIAACTIRFLAVSIGAVESSFSKVSDSLDMAARTLGHGAGRTLRRFHLPLIRGGLLTAALIVFVDCMKELPATLILRPFNFETLATHVYHFASDELIERSAPGALFIVAAGLIPVIILSRTIDTAARLDSPAAPGPGPVAPGPRPVAPPGTVTSTAAPPAAPAP